MTLIKSPPNPYVPLRLNLLGLFCVFLICLPMPVVADTSPSDQELEVLAISPLRDAVYNQILDEGAILKLYSATLTDLEKINNEVSRLRGEALAHYFLGRYYHAIPTIEIMVEYAQDLRNKRYLALRRYYTRREPALDAYRTALERAELLFQKNPNAESHRLLGEIQGQMLFLGTIGDVLSLGPKARRNVDDARELDPGNVKALIQEASRMAYSPPAYGGDPSSARELYREALRQNGRDKEDLFNIYSGFAMASFMDKDDKTAVDWWQEALDIYPGNVFAGGMLIFCRKESK